jgi:hypothetical protein
MRTEARPKAREPQAAPESPETTAPSAAASVIGGGAPEFAARLVPLDPGFYAFSLAAGSGWRDPVAGLALPAVHVCAPPDSDAVAVTDSFGGAGSWLGGRHRMLFVEALSGGGAALVTSYLARDPDAAPLEIEIRRIGDGQAAPGAPISESPPALTLRMSGAPLQQPGQPVAFDVLAHIRGRGDVRFVETPWAGRLGPGLWIEAFTLLTRNQAAAAAIEYKGLTAGGNETPWIGCGAPCGTRGRGLPLIGFAIRQKAVPGGGQFDCEYTGHFQSGVTAGPLRNGAPCLSPNENDPLEGMQLRITPRPPRSAG